RPHGREHRSCRNRPLEIVGPRRCRDRESRSSWRRFGDGLPRKRGDLRRQEDPARGGISLLGSDRGSGGQQVAAAIAPCPTEGRQPAYPRLCPADSRRPGSSPAGRRGRKLLPRTAVPPRLAALCGVATTSAACPPHHLELVRRPEAVCLRTVATWLAVRAGFAAQTSAAAPATSGAENDVPLEKP